MWIVPLGFSSFVSSAEEQLKLFIFLSLEQKENQNQMLYSEAFTPTDFSKVVLKREGKENTVKSK